MDDLLHVLGNPTRVRILQRITAETHYPLQLARELGISQQAVTKHLRVLEDHQMVHVVDEPSDIGGPPRRSYHLDSAFTLSMSVGPQMFQARMAALPSDEGPEEPAQQTPQEARWSARTLQGTVGKAGEVARREREELFDQQFRTILAVQNLKERIVLLHGLVDRVNQELYVLDRQRDGLLRTKGRAMQEASGLILALYQDYHLRSVLYELLSATPLTVAALAEQLGLREDEVAQLLLQLEPDHPEQGRDA